MFQIIIGTLRSVGLMSTELLSAEVELNLQQEEENDDQVLKNVEQEIECPRCYDIMTLSSDFDKLLYICQECDLSLVMKIVRALSSDSSLSLDPKNGSIPSVIKSIFLSNKALLLGTAEILLLVDSFGPITADGVAVGMVPFLLFTSSFVPSLQLYKTVFNTLLC